MPDDSTVQIFFEDGHSTIHVNEGESLSSALNASNSPVLFGCRVGICGTCVVEAEALDGSALPEADFLESQTLKLYAPENKNVRLACQLSACTSLRIKRTL